MRLLVLSNVSGSVDKIVGLLQSNQNIIAKESNATTITMARTAAENLRNGTYDTVIVVARDPIGAGMQLNKQDGVNAAVCGSSEDVKLAKEDGANAIVIRDINADELQDIVVQAAGSGGVMHGIKMPQIKMPEVKMPQFAQKEKEEEVEAEGEEAPRREEKRQKMVSSRKAKEAEEEEAYEEEMHTSSDDSIVGKIKDFFGII